MLGAFFSGIISNRMGFKLMYWIGPSGSGADAGPGTDFDAVRRAYISITPIHVDLTRYQALDQVAGWVAELSMGDATAVEHGA